MTKESCVVQHRNSGWLKYSIVFSVNNELIVAHFDQQVNWNSE